MRLASLLLLHLVATGAVAQGTGQAPLDPGPSSASTSGGPGVSRALNPDIGLNLLGLYRRAHAKDSSVAGHSHGALGNGFSLQESELQLTADVDPYLRANAIFGVHPDGAGGYEIEPEEAYFDTTSLPFVTLRAGKFYAAFGRHNQLHTHAFPFIDAPLINQSLLGDHAFNDAGVSASALLPAPWFLELTLQALDARNDELFTDPNVAGVPADWQAAAVAQLRNLWDLSDSSTIEWNLFGTRGPNAYGEHTTAYGSELVLKWRPTESGRGRAIVWHTQYMNGLVAGRGDASERRAGVASWVQYQFAERWWAQLRGEVDGLHRLEGYPLERRASFLLGYFPSEFSGFRFQFDREMLEGHDHAENVISLQYNISIGAHPAHAY